MPTKTGTMVTLKDKYSGGLVWLNVRDGVVVGATGTEPKRYLGMTLEAARHYARYGGKSTRSHSTSKSSLTSAQRTVLGNIIARGGVSEHDLHMGRMAKGDVRKSVANKLVQMGLVKVEPLWVDVHYKGTRLVPSQTLHQRVNHYYATAAGNRAYGDEPARLS